MTDTHKLLEDVRRAREKRVEWEDRFDEAVLACGDAGVPVRLIAIAAGLGSSTVHRQLQLSRSEREHVGRPPE